MKVCRVCKADETAAKFYKTTGNICTTCHKAKTTEWRLAHPEQVKAIRDNYNSKPENRKKSLAATVKWQKENPQKVKATRRTRDLRQMYGLTDEQFNQMAARQDYACYLCGSDEFEPLEVDHSHRTGNVRKLLCQKCNPALGSLNDDPELMRRAADYVVRFQ